MSEHRYFATYSGVKLPLNLVSPLEEAALANRNTYIRAGYDEAGRMVVCEKFVYGEVEMAHRYEYHANGALKRAEIAMPDEEPAALDFDEAAAPGVRPIRAAGIDEEGP
jgi:hypothetical protein